MSAPGAREPRKWAGGTLGQISAAMAATRSAPEACHTDDTLTPTPLVTLSELSDSGPSRPSQHPPTLTTMTTMTTSTTPTIY